MISNYADKCQDDYITENLLKQPRELSAVISRQSVGCFQRKQAVKKQNLFGGILATEGILASLLTQLHITLNW